jgi:hypothetical protein
MNEPTMWAGHNIDKYIINQKPINLDRGVIGRWRDNMKLTSNEKATGKESQIATYRRKTVEELSSALVIQETHQNRVGLANFEIYHKKRMYDDEFEKSGLEKQLQVRNIESVEISNKRAISDLEISRATSEILNARGLAEINIMNENHELDKALKVEQIKLTKAKVKEAKYAVKTSILEFKSRKRAMGEL